MRDLRLGPNKAAAVVGIFSAMWYPISVANWTQLWWPEHRYVGGVIGCTVLGWLMGAWRAESARRDIAVGLWGLAFWSMVGPLFLSVPQLRPWAGWVLCLGAVFAGFLWGGAFRVLWETLGEIWAGELDLGEVPFSLWSLIGLIILLMLPFFLRPYMGRLGAHLFLAIIWGGYLLRNTALAKGAEAPWRKVLLWGAVSSGFTVFWMWSWPVPLADHEVLYSDAVGGERVTLHARIGEGSRVLALVSQRAMLFQNIQSYRFSETMVHPAMAYQKARKKRILLLGGEDGSLLQEMAKHSDISEVVWIPFYAQWADFFLNAPYFQEVHQKARKHLRVTRVHLSPYFRPFEWFHLLESLQKKEKFSLIFADMPPASTSLGMLFNEQSKKAILSLLAPDGLLVESTASPYRQRRLFWCFSSMWSRMGGHVLPFHLAPSMVNDHGFVWVQRKGFSKLPLHLTIPVSTRYLTKKLPFHTFMRFARDVGPDGKDMQGRCRLPAI
ncbi:MAG: hypothetical protein H6727_09050 [Myxococcales bacterium]|nr:hypothetical protein [Myxococcales bacterium]